MPENSNSTTGKVLGAWFALLLLLGFCGFGQDQVPNLKGEGDDEEVSWYQLTPCSAENSVFAALPYSEWVGYYHTTVNEVINAQIRQLYQQESTAVLQCTSDDFSTLLPATPELDALARLLQPWGARNTPGSIFGTASLPPVGSSDMIPVLMEFLRVYECSLLERQYEGTPPFRQSASSVAGESSSAQADFPDFVEQQTIREELASARPSLERTLLLLSGQDRLQPLVAELSCLERSLTDIRNITGLLAEEASCWNRTWDARGSIRDLIE